MEIVETLLAEYSVFFIGLFLVLVTVVPYIWYESRGSKKTQKKQVQAVEYGLHEPVTISPRVNRDICIGSGACITACPEKDILGKVRGKAEAIYSSRCVGHSACARACPVGAIELVFGTEKRGVDIPQMFPNFETNVERLFIAGELGGMGLIKNAVKQGMEAVDYILSAYKTACFKKEEGMLDLLVVGSGPAGLSATLQAMKQKLKFETVEQEDNFGGAILSYPRAKIVMTNPMTIPLVGKIKNKEFLKEALLELWNDIATKTSLKISFSEKVMETENKGDYFNIKTTKREIKTRYLLLCIGRRGTPRKLGIEGEENSKVMYRLLEPEKYANSNIVVIGGGDSAVEAATALGKQQGARVVLSYRKNTFSRIKPANKKRLDASVQDGRVTLMMESTVIKISPNSVIIESSATTKEIKNDYVFIFAGGELPNAFLKKCGVTVETRFGTH